MFRILLSAGISAASWFEYLTWAREQTEGQISKMQDSAFDTPGAEPPVPSSILVAAVSVVAGHFALTRMLRMRRGQSVLSLILGVAVAVLLLLRPIRVE